MSTTTPGIGVERGSGLGRRATGDDPVGHLADLGLQPQELVPAPGVGLREVDAATEEIPRPEQVAVGSDGVPLRRARRELLLQERGQPGVGLRGRSGTGPQVGAQRPGHPRDTGSARHQAVEERFPATAARPGLALRGDPANLPHRSGVAGIRGRQQRGTQPGQGLGNGGQPGRDRLPVPGLGGGHEIEHHPDVLHRTRDHVELRHVEAGVVDLDVESDPLGEHRRGRRLGVVARLGAPDLGECRPGQLRPGGEPVR